MGAAGTGLFVGAVQSGHPKGATALHIGDLTGNKKALKMEY